VSAEPKLSIVIPSWNTRELLRVCLRTIEAATKPTCEVIVVDNASADGSADMVATDFPDVRLFRNTTNEGFAKGCNRGITEAAGECILLHNADTEVYPDALERMIGFLDEHAEYGAAAPRLVNADGSTQGGCMAFPSLWTPLFYGTPLERWSPNSRELRRYFVRDFDHETDCDIEQPPAACLLVRRTVLDEIGPFDEKLWLFFNDVDLSLRLSKAGFKTRFVKDAKVMHHVGASTSQFGGMHVEWQKNRLYYYRKHFGRIAGLWVKLCVIWTFLDFAGAQLLRRVTQKSEPQPVRPLWDALKLFLRS
jgi:GT2 family glycosyltransferase